MKKVYTLFHLNIAGSNWCGKMENKCFFLLYNIIRSYYIKKMYEIDWKYNIFKLLYLKNEKYRNEISCILKLKVKYFNVTLIKFRKKIFTVVTS